MVQVTSKSDVRTTPTGTPFIFGARTGPKPPPYDAGDSKKSKLSRADSEKTKLAKKTFKQYKLEGDTHDNGDVNLKGYKRLNQDDVIPMNVLGDAGKEIENQQQKTVGFDNKAYQSGSDVENM
jgi:hypothetical protein